MNNNYIVLECRTKNRYNGQNNEWRNIHELDLSIACIYDGSVDQYKIFNDIEKLNQYLNNRYVISFNSIRFDSYLLLGNDRELTNDALTRNSKYSWKNIDISIEIIRQIQNMNRNEYQKIFDIARFDTFSKGIFDRDMICKNTLSIDKKTKYPLHQLYTEKKYIELIEDCLFDLRMIHKLYTFIRVYKYIITGDHNVVSF